MNEFMNKDECETVRSLELCRFYRAMKRFIKECLKGFEKIKIKFLF